MFERVHLPLLSITFHSFKIIFQNKKKKLKEYKAKLFNDFPITPVYVQEYWNSKNV